MTEQILVYISQDQGLSVKVPLDQETVRLSQDQMTQLFGRDQSVISRHIKNIYTEKEVEKKSTMQKMHITNSDKPVEFYNLDIIISVGYRVKSQEGVRFRQRATHTLRSHIIDGYTINQQRIQHNYESFLNTVSDIQHLVQGTNLHTDDVLELIKTFGQTRFTLDSYDKGTIPTEGYTAETISLEVAKLYDDIAIFKQELIGLGQATELFAQEKSHSSLEGIFGSVFQSAFGEDVYPTLEEKAAHLLYFIVKNHPFNDGNKRTGAFAFIRFLSKVGYQFRTKITPEALTALTLLIAQSNPKDKKNITGLIILLLKQ